MASFRETGVLSLTELKGRVPPLERLRLGPCAVIECVEEIPCNPCEESCPFGAIHIGPEITALPKLDFDRCTGCGTCLGVCPGLAIFLVDLSMGEGKAHVTVPYELLPIPEEGEGVQVLSRAGEALGEGRVVRVRRAGTTVLVTVEVPEEWAMEARAVKVVRDG
ncbi:4Fe-4S binding protein [Candidatus Bipolaricaulota bacterium]|nr:4Fe-4S binding protein [Candidatus Bipolaricaulota bacterium]